MKAVAIVQARMGSSRLPGKVMRSLEGKSVLAHVIERIKACTEIDEVVVATTTKAADDCIVEEAFSRGAGVYRGSEHDVLRRYLGAARQAGAQIVTRVTADCPLIDPEVLSQMLAKFMTASAAGRIDYLSNTLERSFPRGLDCELFSFSALERAEREAAKPHQREHVTPFIWEHPGLFVLAQHVCAVDRSALRWTLDVEEDWNFFTALFRALRESGSPATSAAVLALLDRRPELGQINAHVEQKRVAS